MYICEEVEEVKDLYLDWNFSSGESNEKKKEEDVAEKESEVYGGAITVPTLLTKAPSFIITPLIAAKSDDEYGYQQDHEYYSMDKEINSDGQIREKKKDDDADKKSDDAERNINKPQIIKCMLSNVPLHTLRDIIAIDVTSPLVDCPLNSTKLNSLKKKITKEIHHQIVELESVIENFLIELADSSKTSHNPDVHLEG
ncbi:hypothetical protein RFI_03284 [Reticulomyxa filosa]|uniref:Uncharacterized protein n=1 Tax=Reticulomyxa filosa TaxID=46433 RepID=X6P6V3_RETFI|nr:hypothetical protein RFI_03284 [Reticulomyxa filosa]|eukprot:ETO33819.1 hypothetical protein RFI_03284 [Reticulomyxa filosa]